jgi:hypothetical protein
MPRYCFLELDKGGEPSRHAIDNEGSFMVDICRSCYDHPTARPWPHCITDEKEVGVIEEMISSIFCGEERKPHRWSACAVDEGSHRRSSDVGEAHCRFSDEDTMAASVDGCVIDHPPYEDDLYKCAICDEELEEKDY